MYVGILKYVPTLEFHFNLRSSVSAYDVDILGEIFSRSLDPSLKSSSSALIPRDYFVPNFGKDTDMTGTMNSLSIAEAQRQHKLIMGTPESRAKYANKAKDTQYNYYPKLDTDVTTT